MCRARPDSPRHRFEPGDYVFINSDTFPHGFLIVGTGPVLSCEKQALDGVSFNTTTLDIAYTGKANDGPNILDFKKSYSVPYVVDWNGHGTQFQRPRPFITMTQRS